MLSLKVLIELGAAWYITANRDHIVRQVVAYKKLKTIKNKTFRTKNDQDRSGGRLREVLIEGI